MNSTNQGFTAAEAWAAEKASNTQSARNEDDERAENTSNGQHNSPDGPFECNVDPAEENDVNPV